VPLSPYNNGLQLEKHEHYGQGKSEGKQKDKTDKRITSYNPAVNVMK
jgi:hypothetical protein